MIPAGPIEVKIRIRYTFIALAAQFSPRFLVIGNNRYSGIDFALKIGLGEKPPGK
jgi:hypothetical protein